MRPVGILEYGFDRQVEHARNLVGEVERRDMLVGFKRDDGLTRHPQLSGEIGLCQAFFGAKLAKALFHGAVLCLPKIALKAPTIPNMAQKTG